MSNECSIDLSKYQTDQVSETVAGILSVQQSVSTVFVTVLKTVSALLVACTLLWLVGEPNLIEFLLISIYALLAASCIGLILGLVRVAWKLVGNGEKLMDLIVETSRLAVQDVIDVRQGEKQMPDAGEIVRYVYDDVFVPMIEKAVAGTAGILALPLLWTYRVTIGFGIRKLISRLKAESLTSSEANRIEDEVESGISKLADSAPGIDAALSGARGLASYTAGTIRTFILLPIQLLFLVVVCTASIPIIVYWLWLR